MPPILLTGAAGFIGSHVARALVARGEQVMGVDNLSPYYDVTLKQARIAAVRGHAHTASTTGGSFTFIQGDITDRAFMEKLWSSHGPFLRVIHLAAQPGVRYSLQNPYEYVMTNVLGHLTVLEMCRHTPGFEHLVYASSSSVYGANTKQPFSVDDPVTTPLSLYAATKRSDELMSYTYAHLYGIPQTGLRFFTVYGPWGRPDMAPFIFTRAILAGEKLPVFNQGNMRRDFTFIDDIVTGILGALDHPPISADAHPPHRVLNIGNNKSEKLLDFIHEIEKALGRKAVLDLQPMQPGDVYETYADITETTRVTGYQPTTPIHIGIPKFIDWYCGYFGVARTANASNSSHASTTGDAA